MAAMATRWQQQLWRSSAALRCRLSHPEQGSRVAAVGSRAGRWFSSTEADKLQDKKVAATVDDKEPEGSSAAGHGFEEQSSVNEKRFAGDHKAYGKVQDDFHHVAEKAKGIKPEKAQEQETLENTGFDISKKTAPSGGG